MLTGVDSKTSGHKSQQRGSYRPQLRWAGITSTNWKGTPVKRDASGGRQIPSAVVAEGIPPIPLRLVEKIRRWEFVDLATLLNDSLHKADDTTAHQQGQVLVQTLEQAQRRRRQIVDIFTWVRAFSIYTAALASAEATSKEEVVGLISHLHLINQLSRELGGSQWLRYDTDFREWAAAKGVRKWGELNLTLYGRCLSYGLGTSGGSPAPSSSNTGRGNWPKQGNGRRSKSSRQASKACYQWNFDGGCFRTECHYPHVCFHCGDTHRVGECNSAKRARKDGPIAGLKN